MPIKLNINICINSILLVFILFNNIELTKGNYIKIPFNVIYENEQEVFNSLDDYFKSWYYISFYGQISVGTPPKKIIAKLNFDDYGISILNKGCNYKNISDDIDSSLNVEDASSSFHNSTDYGDKNETFYYKSFYGAYYVKDHFYFDTINDKTKVEDLKFIYSPNDNKKESTCFNIGFKAFSRNLRETDLNIIKQLKNKNIINNYDWSIQFDSSMKYPDKGIFVIGAKPHEYNPELYKEKDLFVSGSYADEIIPYYNIQVYNIYFINNEEKVSITDLDKLVLIPTIGLIKGSQDYEKKIEIYFFNYFISQNKCFKEYRVKESKDSFRTFICYNKDEIKKELKDKFPTLKFVQKNFVYTFELTYDDLFKEKGDKIYFLIWFSSSVKTEWEIGYPFMKKYLFNYNYDNKVVSFYNNIEENNNEPDDSKSWIKKLIIIVVLIIIVTALGFFIGKNFVNKKKKNAQELDSEIMDDNEILNKSED
jgi:hypothetical protein